MRTWSRHWGLAGILVFLLNTVLRVLLNWHEMSDGLWGFGSAITSHGLSRRLSWFL